MSSIEGSGPSARGESVISAQALVITSSSNETAATAPKNTKVGREGGTAAALGTEAGAGSGPAGAGSGAVLGSGTGAGSGAAAGPAALAAGSAESAGEGTPSCGSV